MERTIWMDDWQMQCCGTPFEVGSHVEWTVLSASEEFGLNLAALVGPDVAERVTHVETHHGPEGDDDPPLAVATGTVKSIEAVYWQLAPRPNGPEQVLFPVPGSGRLEPRAAADGWEDEEDGGPSFAGYIVGLSSAT